jgi:hypothetical protein
MYVQIEAKADIGSRGKTSWFNTGDLRAKDPSQAIALKAGRPAHLGNPESYIEISATCSRFSGTGERGGGINSIDYKLIVQLTPIDVRRIVAFAKESGLLV